MKRPLFQSVFPEGENHLLATNHTETIHFTKQYSIGSFPISNMSYFHIRKVIESYYYRLTKTKHPTFRVDTGKVLNY
jgi:hypothetical protein